MSAATTLLALAAAAVAPPSATWRTTEVGGQVTAVTGVVRTGGRIVADHFVADAQARAEERAARGAVTAPPGSCARVATARPFTRLRRFAASGRLLWEWRVDRTEQALRLAASGAADCLSPDGGRLTVAIHRAAPGEPPARMGDGVVAVDRRPRFVTATGRAATYGSGDTALVGWKRGAPATLLFEVDRGDGRAIRDEAVLR